MSDAEIMVNPDPIPFDLFVNSCKGRENDLCMGRKMNHAWVEKRVMHGLKNESCMGRKSTCCVFEKQPAVDVRFVNDG